MRSIRPRNNVCTMNLRVFAIVCVSVSWLLAAAGCGDRPNAPGTPVAPGAPPPAPATSEVVLYSSLDGDILPALLEPFEKQTGIRVRLVGDTEATKAVGLVQRLITEKDRARADVFWNSEATGTLRLWKEGLLEPYAPKNVSEAEGWTTVLQGVRHRWHAVGMRPRVMIVNTKALPRAMDRPETISDLTKSLYKGRVGLAKPMAGTTLGHMAAILTLDGEKDMRVWLMGLRRNAVRLYDGNGAVARAVGTGEVHVGVVDLDDALSAQANGWPVEVIAGRARPDPRAGLLWGGTLMTPGTAAIITGGPNPDNAKRLKDFLVSADVERALAEGPQRWMPVRKSLQTITLDITPADPVMVDWERVQGNVEAFMTLWGEVMR